MFVEARSGCGYGLVSGVANSDVHDDHALRTGGKRFTMFVGPVVSELFPLRLHEIGVQIPPHSAVSASGHRF